MRRVEPRSFAERAASPAAKAGMREGDRIDLARMTRSTGHGDTLIGEAVFAPSSKSGGESDGYILTYAYEGDVTKFLVLHAADIAGEPAAVLRVPQRVPFGLHGNWVPASVE